MTSPTDAIVLRPAVPGDRFMIRRWLLVPEVAAAWGNHARAEAEIALAMQSPSSLCRIVECDGQASGYAHAVDAGLWGETLPPDVPPGCWDLDLFIASAEHCDHNLGGRVLELLTAEVFATTLAVACCIFVSIRNEAAVRTYERIGYRWIRLWQDPHFGPCWVLLKPRSSRA